MQTKYRLSAIVLGTALVAISSVRADTVVSGVDGASNHGDLQGLVDSAPATGRTILIPAGVLTLKRPILIEKKSNLVIRGADIRGTKIVIPQSQIQFRDRQAAFWVTDDVNQLTISDLSIRGWITAHSQANVPNNTVLVVGIAAYDQQRTRGIRYRNLDIANVTTGISVSGLCPVDALGQYTNSPDSNFNDVIVENNYFHDIIGTISGVGYGLASSCTSETTFRDNIFRNIGRHAIYRSMGNAWGNGSPRNGIFIYGNLFLKHGDGIPDPIHEGRVMPPNSALTVSRSSHAVTAFNTFVRTATSPFDVCWDSMPRNSIYVPRMVQVLDNHFLKTAAQRTITTIQPNATYDVKDFMFSPAPSNTSQSVNFRSNVNPDSPSGFATSFLLMGNFPQDTRDYSPACDPLGSTGMDTEGRGLYCGPYTAYLARVRWRNDNPQFPDAGIDKVVALDKEGNLNLLRPTGTAVVEEWAATRLTGVKWHLSRYPFQAMAAGIGSKYVYVMQNGTLHRLDPNTGAYTYMRYDWGTGVKGLAVVKDDVYLVRNLRGSDYLYLIEGTNPTHWPEGQHGNVNATVASSVTALTNFKHIVATAGMLFLVEGNSVKSPTRQGQRLLLPEFQ